MRNQVHTWFRANAIAYLFLAITIANAQSITNGGLDINNCNITNDSPFFNGCVPGWRASHGSPNLKSTGDLYAYMFAQSGVGEGIFTTVTGLTPNVPYELSFFARGYGGPTLSVKLATNLGTGGSSAGGGSIPGASTVWNQSFYPTNPVWTQYTVQLTVPTSGNYQLWFYPETATRNSTKYEVHINGVSLDPAGCLTRDVLFQNTAAFPQDTRTQGTIKAGSSVNPFINNGPAQILNGQSVILGAGTVIEFREGFSAEEGAYLTANYVGSSNCAASRPANSDDWWYVTPKESAPNDSTMGYSINRAAGRTSVEAAYPNPAVDVLTIPSGGQDAKATLYNQHGKVCRQLTLPSKVKQTNLQVDDLPAGLYSLRIITTDGRITMQQIEIRR